MGLKLRFWRLYIVLFVRHASEVPEPQVVIPARPPLHRGHLAPGAESEVSLNWSEIKKTVAGEKIEDVGAAGGKWLLNRNVFVSSD